MLYKLQTNRGSNREKRVKEIRRCGQGNEERFAMRSDKGWRVDEAERYRRLLQMARDCAEGQRKLELNQWRREKDWQMQGLEVH